MAEAKLSTSTGNSSLRDVLELVLDKGIVIVGDIQIKIADVDLLTIKIRLLVCGVDKALEMGINWWQDDPYLSSKARENEIQQQEALLARLEKLEARNNKLS
ncbi:MAG TPA: gas vesicle protein [Bacteroidales bacterium]|nr:MAG: gas vesicle protein [Bacteroidetes bacterium GWE2_42_24]OFY29309.1 MAG: gas vesicle protein [Bacteroidetes bacterium GWF2_43_11]HBZ66689.1 gas vesicle protein [Bacteroidales bacterium]